MTATLTAKDRYKVWERHCGRDAYAGFENATLPDSLHLMDIEPGLWADVTDAEEEKVYAFALACLDDAAGTCEACRAAQEELLVSPSGCAAGHHSTCTGENCSCGCLHGGI